MFISHARKNYFQVPTIHKKQIFYSDPQKDSPAPRTYVPRPTKTDANSPNMASSLRKKYEKNLTFAPKAVIITLWSLKVRIDLSFSNLHLKEDLYTLHKALQEVHNPNDLQSLKKSRSHFVVGTPGRVYDMLKNLSLNFMLIFKLQICKLFLI